MEGKHSQDEDAKDREKVEAAKNHSKFPRYLAYLREDESLRELLDRGEYIWGHPDGDVYEDLKGWDEWLAEEEEKEADASQVELSQPEPAASQQE